MKRNTRRLMERMHFSNLLVKAGGPVQRQYRASYIRGLRREIGSRQLRDRFKA